MSDKGDATIKKESKPKLRFPEFNDAGNWLEILLYSVAKPVSDKATKLKNEVILTLSAEEGLIQQGEYFGKKIAGENIERYTKILLNDFVYNDRTTRQYIYGTIKRLSRYEGGVVSPIYKCFRFNKDEVPAFWEGYFESGMHESRLRSLINEGARAGRFNISIQQFLSTLAWRPKREEQHKIADCLSSVDDLITAQSKKIDALKRHKKSLMHQLFPAEGETVPRLRFAEFSSAPHWKEFELNDIGKLVAGLTYSPEDIRDTGLLVLRSSNIQNSEISLIDNVFVSPSIKGANLSEQNDILICVRNGSKNLIGKSALIPTGMPLCTHGAFMTIFRTKSWRFIFQLFQTSAYQKQVDGDLGATINSINGSRFLKYKFFMPLTSEQNKIADLLYSLDELITAQSQKLMVLKSHKMGLMHQLFSCLSEAGNE